MFWSRTALRRRVGARVERPPPQTIRVSPAPNAAVSEYRSCGKTSRSTNTQQIRIIRARHYVRMYPLPPTWYDTILL